MKFKDYLNELNKIAKLHPESHNMEVIYSHDDEGNEYQKVNNIPNLCQVHSLKNNRDLELVGYYSGDEHIDINDCNAIMIN